MIYWGAVAFPVNFDDPFEIGLVEVVESGKLALLIIANSIRKQCAILKNISCNPNIDKVSMWYPWSDSLWKSQWHCKNSKYIRYVQRKRIPHFVFKSPAIFSPAGATSIS